jgi:hyaluronan synthase
MYAFLVQFVDFLRTHEIHYFLIFFFFIWLRWFVVNGIALRYKPYAKKHKTTTSIIIPVVSEPADVFTKVLNSIIAQSPDQIIVVINGPRNKELEYICSNFPGVDCHWVKKPGKRNAIDYGMKHVTGDVVVLVDSDTIWTEDTLAELIKPFADPTVGGVTTRQKITDPTATLISRLCDWLEDVRAYGTMQAMSVFGQIGCLPGRTIAFRRDILKQVMPEFMNEKFLGMHKEVSDDRSLTNLTLKAGFKTVMQTTSVVYTEAPTRWKVFLRQQLRWSEGSQYNNIRMTPWMLKNAKLMFFIYWSDMLMPFFLWGIYLSYMLRVLLFGVENNSDLLFLNNTPVMMLFAITLAGAYFSYAIRQLRVLNESPRHFVFLPLYIIILTFILAPVRMLGFARLADDMGWGTRANSYVAKKKASLKGRLINATAS